jgi:hypothetical protein
VLASSLLLPASHSVLHVILIITLLLLSPGYTYSVALPAPDICRAVQSNVAAASARVLVHCSVCFLLTTMVLLADAALVAGLHAGAGLPLSVSFAVAVGANLGLVLLLFAALLLVRCLNRSSDRAMSQALTGPQVGEGLRHVQDYQSIVCS